MSNILVVEDQPEVARMMKRALEPTHKVELAEGVLEGMDMLNSGSINLVLLDISLPGLSGLELCRRIKGDVLLRHTPIILVTGMARPEDRVTGLNLGADDYVTKPFNIQELVARVEAVVRRNAISLEANPLTRLPGNGAIEREILRCIEARKPFSVFYADLNEFKAFNDYYGFHRGDLVIQATADILLKSTASRNRLVGHIGGDDFIIVTEDPDVKGLCQSILQNFNAAVPTFYDEKDIKAGSITMKDRQGKVRSYNLLSLAIGVVTNTVRPIHSVGEVAAIGAEVKGVAKRQKGSAYFIDRRHDDYSSR